MICFAYLPLLFANMFGPAVGALITQQSLFVSFPAAFLTMLGVGAVARAAAQNANGCQATEIVNPPHPTP